MQTFCKINLLIVGGSLILTAAVIIILIYTSPAKPDNIRECCLNGFEICTQQCTWKVAATYCVCYDPSYTCKLLPVQGCNASAIYTCNLTSDCYVDPSTHQILGDPEYVRDSNALSWSGIGLATFIFSCFLLSVLKWCIRWTYECYVDCSSQQYREI